MNQYMPTPKSEYYKVNTPKGLWLLDDNGKKISVYPDGTVVKYIKKDDNKKIVTTITILKYIKIVKEDIWQKTF